MAEEALQTNSYTKIAKPTTGKSKGQFGIGVFGRATFGKSTGFQMDKEVRKQPSLTSVALSATKIGS